MPYRIIFAGTPEFTVPTLDALMQSAHEVLAVYTQPDRRGGRGRKQLIKSAVKIAAENYNLTVHQPESLKDKTSQDALFSYDADVMIVMGYGMLLPEIVFDHFPLGAINPHVSLLPKWRGGAPIQRAIEAGDSETGVSIMQIDKGMDSGPVFMQKKTAIEADDTNESIENKLSVLAAEGIIETLDLIEKNKITAEPQDVSQKTIAKLIKKQEGEIDWSKSAVEINRKIRAFYPWPIAFTRWCDEAFKIYRAEVLDISTCKNFGEIINADKNGIDVCCGEGVLRISECQIPGGRRMPVSEFVNAKKALLQEYPVFE